MLKHDEDKKKEYSMIGQKRDRVNEEQPQPQQEQQQPQKKKRKKQNNNQVPLHHVNNNNNNGNDSFKNLINGMCIENKKQQESKEQEWKNKIQDTLAKLQECTKKLEDCKDERHLYRKKLDLQEQIVKYKKEIKEFEDEIKKLQINNHIVPFLQEQERCKDMNLVETKYTSNITRSITNPPSNSSSSSSTSSSSLSTSSSSLSSSSCNVSGLSMTMMNKPTVMFQRDDICECGTRLMLEPEQSIMICQNTFCGKTRKYIDSTASSTAFGEDVEFNNYSYNRETYFDEYMNQFQAKPSKPLKLQPLMDALYDLYELRQSDDIQFMHVYSAIRQRKLKQLYKLVMQCYVQVTNNKPFRFTSKQIEKFKQVFREIQDPYDRYAGNRVSFFSYPYCLYKILELFKYNELLPMIPLLKDEKKLKIQDKIWKLICQEKNWEYHDTMPPAQLIEPINKPSSYSSSCKQQQKQKQHRKRKRDLSSSSSSSSSLSVSASRITTTTTSKTTTSKKKQKISSNKKSKKINDKPCHVASKKIKMSQKQHHYQEKNIFAVNLRQGLIIKPINN